MTGGRDGPDLEVRFRPDLDPTVGDLARIWPVPPSGTGSGTGTAPTAHGLVVDGRVMAPGTLLTESGLVDGAVVDLGPPPPERPHLVIVAGPLAAAAFPLTGATVLGRGLRCPVRLDHPSVAPAHVLVEPGTGTGTEGWRACGLADAPARLDGEPLAAPRALGAGAVLSVGPVDLQLLLAEPPAAVTPPRAPVHRAARGPDPPIPDPGPPPAPPSTPPPPTPPGLLTLAGPVAVGGVLAVTVHPTAGLVTAATPLLAVGAHLDGRRRHRRDRRRADGEHATALAAHTDIADRGAAARAARARTVFPTAVDALAVTRHGRGLWAARGAEAGVVAVGWADDDHRTPVTVDLHTGRLGVAGPPHWADGVRRAVHLQLATRAAPTHRPDVVVETADAAAGLTDRCTAVLTWRADGAVLSDTADGRHRLPVRPFLATADLAREAERLRARWTDPEEGGDLPDEVGLADLADLRAGTGGDGRQRLAAPLGVGVDGPLQIDLVADGPHALVAGTTGSGKSELLRTWVVGLAAGHPPAAVAFVLVDYKGGSAFDACAGLPHVAGLVTDLDPGLGRRLVTSLRAEVRDREAALRAGGVADLRDLAAGPPRLVVVVDEFATLATELPEVLEALVDVARRGRSLGIHLVLATQRPAGAVTDDIRANTALRICLRTLEPADTHDVLGVAAGPLPAGRPGRAWVRRGEDPVLVQVASGHRPRVTDAPPVTVLRAGETGPGADEGPSELQAVVEAIGRDQVSGPRPAPAWLPPLPERLPPPDDHPGPVVLGRLDLPDARRQPWLTWDPDHGALAVVGGAGRGRTGALRSVVTQLATRRPGRHVHVVDAGSGLGDLAGLPTVGAVVPAGDRALLARLVARLSAAGPPTVLVVDGWDALAATATDGPGLRLLDALDALCALPHVTVAVTSRRPRALPRATAGGTVLTLALDDPADWALAGLRPPPGTAPPGRAWTADGHELQLVLPPDALPVVDPPPGPAPVTVEPLPSVVTLDGHHRLPGAVTLGLRERDLAPARWWPGGGRPFVVAGPPRSGRSAALALVAAQLPRELGPRLGPLDLRAWTAAPHPAVVLVDDAESVPDPDGSLRELITRRHPDAVVVLAVRTDGWRSSWLADLRPWGLGLALAPDPVHDAERWSVPLPDVGPTPPAGRAVLVDGPTAEVVQVARAEPTPSPARPPVAP